ncbi:hypothetical protein GBA52_001047 [Prunus armeniaca]|nr:hypothetical protein GBA52_001047 [Prunus armeniaca]
MELQLGLSLALPVQNPVKGFDMSNRGDGVEKKEILVGLESIKNKFETSAVLMWLLMRVPEMSLKCCPCYCGVASQMRKMMRKGKKRRDSVSVITKNEGEGNHVVGWPPIKIMEEKRCFINTTLSAMIIIIIISATSSPESVIGKKIRVAKRVAQVQNIYLLIRTNKELGLLVADVPWQTFIKSVQRLQILRNGFSALDKIIDHWDLGNQLSSFTIDPCTPNATWASSTANPRVICDCAGSTCHITHLSIYALDILGEIPRELFELKELIDLNLGQNVLSGPIPAEIGQLSKLQYLSLGINNLTGPVPQRLGTYPSCFPSSFSIKCGGTSQTHLHPALNMISDSETLGAASFYKSSRWAVSSTENFVFNSNGPRYIASTDSQITETLESELYKTARLSPSSLRVRRVLKTSTSRRKQGVKEGTDKNIQNKRFQHNHEHPLHVGWQRALAAFHCKGTYGPSVSAINVRQVPGAGNSANRGEEVGRIVGISLGCAAAVVIVSSVFYLWWIKDDAPGHMRVHTDIPKK